MKHDSSTYRNHDCRCEECTVSHAAYCRRARQRRAERLAAGISVAVHGKSTTYTNHACRCAECTAAHREARQEWAKRRDGVEESGGSA